MKTAEKLEAELTRVRELLDASLRMNGHKSWRAELEFIRPGECRLIVTAPSEYEQTALDYIVGVLKPQLSADRPGTTEKLKPNSKRKVADLGKIRRLIDIVLEQLDARSIPTRGVDSGVMAADIAPHLRAAGLLP